MKAGPLAEYFSIRPNSGDMTLMATCLRIAVPRRFFSRSASPLLEGRNIGAVGTEFESDSIPSTKFINKVAKPSGIH